MYILYFPKFGGYLAFSRNSRILSTPVLDAPSISIISIEFPLMTPLQFSQTLQGSPSFDKLRQFTARARILAVVVLPTPRGPQNRKA